MITSLAHDADFLESLKKAALAAGDVLRRYHRQNIETWLKEDSSPVTQADQAAEAVILAALRALTPKIPIVAEEEAAAHRLPDVLGDCFYLVDPLDGTKEFINGFDDFTVNIALIIAGIPVVGVIFVPMTGQLYAANAKGAYQWCIDSEGRAGQSTPLRIRQGARPVTVLASRSHRTPQTDAYLANYQDAHCLCVGSSLKFCMLAAGEGDIYPRFGRTMEWDTAAGDAILRAAGGGVVTLDGKPLLYGKRNPGDCDFENPDFIAFGDASALRLNTH